MKANHNTVKAETTKTFIIHKIRQTHFWKQTTTPVYEGKNRAILYTKFVKHTFESKPQPNDNNKQRRKDYTQNSSNTLLKANHNISGISCVPSTLYTKFVKHTFESKPQRYIKLGFYGFNYTQNSSNTLLKANHNLALFQVYLNIIIHKIRQTHFWKQTTTGAMQPIPDSILYTKFVKHTFESKPQLRNSWNVYLLGIIHKIRQTHFWKQTTTLHGLTCILPLIIHKIRQTHFWKQTTTKRDTNTSNLVLYTKFVKHTFESKPQLFTCLPLEH